MKAIDLIKQFEGCRLKAYKAVQTEKYYTIGYGHYGADVFPNMEITQEQADKMLEKDLKKYENAVDKSVKVSITENQRSALISFTYNVGIGAFTKSTLLKKLNAGDYNGASDEFPKWCKSGGKVLKGLERRRTKERELFLTK